MNEIEKEMLARFLKMRRRMTRLETELKHVRDKLADFGYVATLQYPGFIYHASKTIPAHATDKSPQDLMNLILMWGRLGRPPGWQRQPGESARHWMKRLEASFAKEKKEWTAAKIPAK